MPGTVGAAWVDAVVSLGGVAATAAGAAAELERRYAEPHRHYHGTAHVEAVLRDAGRLGDEVGLDGDTAALVALAVCAHDVVYDGEPGADERASAAWARERLTELDLPRAAVDRVEALVLATAQHTADPDDLARAVLCDADLAILAAAPGEYAAYVAAVRREYARVPEPDWVRGRTAVLAGLLRLPTLYVTAAARTAWEDVARANVGAELARLAGTLDG